MGNCLALCRPNSGSCISSPMANHGKVVRVAKPDGKVLEFSSPTHVKDILKNFNPAFGVGVSKATTSSELLSPDYELKVGRLYYLLPSQCSPSNLASLGNKEQGNGTKRIKVVITKQQLQLLVSKQISIEDMLSEVQTVCVGLPNNRKPRLDSIPEENE